MKQICLYFPLIFTALQLWYVALDIDTICGSECTDSEAYNTTLTPDYAEALCYFTYQQDIISEQCNGSDLPRYHHLYCTRTESGKYCAEFSRQLDLYSYNYVWNTFCKYSQTNCTPECQSYIDQLTDELGCCLNAERVVTLGSDASCSIANKCHLTVEPIARVTEPQRCQQDLYYFYHFYEECTIRPDLRQKAISKLYDNSCLKDVAFRLYALCDKNQNGEYCHNISSAYRSTYISDVYLRCNLDTNCSTSCRETLIEGKKQYGCCANSYLYSDYYFHNKICQARKDIWSHCNIESPGFCSNDFQFRGSETGLRYVQSLLLLSLLIAVIEL